MTPAKKERRKRKERREEREERERERDIETHMTHAIASPALKITYEDVELIDEQRLKLKVAIL